MARMKADARVALLAGTPMFSACNKKELARIASLTDEVAVNAGQVLCKEGEIGNDCFLLVDTDADVRVKGRKVASIPAGSICGELALLDGGPRAATVTAVSDGRILIITRSAFLGLIAEVPTIARRMLEALGTRIRDANAIGENKPLAGG
jgi:CRP/FNR family transcriptional regulator, cyclic AMP receptor protein